MREPRPSYSAWLPGNFVAGLRNLMHSSFYFLYNNVALGRRLMPSDTKTPRTDWGCFNGQSRGSVITINKVCGTSNIISNTDF